jgi:hypothetical protein
MCVRSFLNQNNCGMTPLQMIMIQVDIQYGPNRRSQKAVFSASTPLYHAMKYSMKYA